MANAFNGLGMGLGNLARLSNAKTRKKTCLYGFYSLLGSILLVM